MDEAHDLFLSLPPAAQTHLRTVASLNKAPASLKLLRAAYLYVQTIADAQDVADFLASGADSNLQIYQRVALDSPSLSYPRAIQSAH